MLNLEHPDLAVIERYGEIPKHAKKEPIEKQGWIYDGENGDKYLWCECGKLNYISINKVWKMPNGEYYCKNCIQEYMEDYFSQYLVEE